MSNKTVKLTTLEKIKDQIRKVEKIYKESKKRNDESSMEKCEERYKELRVLLFSNESYFENLNSENLSEQLAKTTDTNEISQINSKLRQKEKYLNNSSYINLIDECDTINKLKQRKFKKKVLTVGVLATLAALTTTMYSCNRLKDNKDEKEDKYVVSEENSSEIINDTVANTEEEKNSSTTQQDNLVTEDEKVNSTTEKDNTTDDNSISDKTNENNSLNSESHIEYLNPNVSNYNEEVIIPEITPDEQPAIDYPFTQEDNTELNKDEKTEDPVIVYEEAPKIPDNMPVDETTTQTSKPENTQEQEKPSNSESENNENTIVTEEEAPKIPDDMPIEEDENDVTYYSEENSYTLTLHM